MKKIIFAILSCFFIGSVFGDVFADDIKTEISEVYVNNILLANAFSKDIIIEPTDKITFVFSKKYKYSSSTELTFLIDFNNGELKKTIIDNKITFSDLSEGIYLLNVQAFFDENNEIIPTNIKFIIKIINYRQKLTVPFYSLCGLKALNLK